MRLSRAVSDEKLSGRLSTGVADALVKAVR
jgi:hypothetical protein